MTRRRGITRPAVDRTTQIGFGMVDKSVLWDQTLPPNVKAVYAYLTTYCGDARVAFPSKATIARHTGLSVRSVDKAVNVGKACGLWSVESEYDPVRGVHYANTYLLRDLGGGYAPGSGPVTVEHDEPTPVADEAGDPQGGTAPGAGGTAPGAHYQDKGPRPEDQETTSPAARPHADARRRQRRAAARNPRAERRADYPAADDWISTDPDELVVNILDHVEALYGEPPGLTALMLSKAAAVPQGEGPNPQYLMNLALKAARWHSVDFAWIKQEEARGARPPDLCRDCSWHAPAVG
jgi:hypothetical protein